MSVDGECPRTRSVLSGWTPFRSWGFWSVVVSVATALVAFAGMSPVLAGGTGGATTVTGGVVPGGMNFGSGYENQTLEGLSPAQQSAVMAAVAATGASWVRLDYDDEPGPGIFSWNWDSVVEAAVGQDLNVDALLQPPPWVFNSVGALEVNTFSTYIIQEAEHLSGLGVHVFEILNEPNLNISPVGGVPVADYALLLRDVYPAIHANVPNAVVLAGGSGLALSSGSQLSPIDYLTQMYKDGATGYFDALSLHPDIYPSLPEEASSWNPWTYMPQLHSLMAANGDGSKLIWYTEFGAPTSGNSGAVSLPVQALSYTQAFSIARSWSWSGPLFAFDWEDSSDGAFGLNTASGQPKPALQAFEQAIGVQVADDAAPAPSQAVAFTSPATLVLQEGTIENFTLTVTGEPVPSITESGTLPAGMNFSDGVIWGVPTSTSGGTYNLTFTASNGSAGSVSQPMTLIVDQAPSFTSSASATFVVGSTGAFTPTAIGSPAPVIAEVGDLPSGLSFSGGTLSGSPAVGTNGSYPVTFTASNGVSPVASQSATVIVASTLPTVASLSPPSGPSEGGTTVTITGTGFLGATAVTFGPTAATSFQVVSATQITAVAPAGIQGTHNVQVVTPGGPSPLSSADVFSYVVPTITSLSPSSGPSSGGTTVTIKGTDFTGATAVTFGPNEAASFQVVSPTQITAVAPAGSGTPNVQVIVPGGSSVLAAGDNFSYLGPTVASLSPSSGPSEGGTTVTITGTGFLGATAVTFGPTAATSFQVVSATQITAVAPAGSGTPNVQVVGPGGSSALITGDNFTYVVPTVTSLSPSSGPSSGGTTVTIKGTDFTGATAVTFGPTAATSFQVVSATQITAVAPAGSGTPNVQVVGPGGSSALITGDNFTYVVPTVTSLSPSSGPSSGGTTVTIKGTDFTGATAVTFGPNEAASFQVVSPTQITAVAPAGSGTPNVQVIVPGGSSVLAAGDNFSYLGPTVASLSPPSGPSEGGTTVTITGTGFLGATAVTFGPTAATSFQVVSATQITAVAPAGSGTPNVQVIVPGASSVLAAGDNFSYLGPTVASLSPSSGPSEGGTTVTITGTGFLGATAVTFGPTAATSFQVVSATQITAVAPAGIQGTHNVQVVTPGGPSPLSSADVFSYVVPTITSLSPSSGPSSGGTTVTIKGTDFTGATAVTFGPNEAASFQVVSPTQITAVAPAGSGTPNVQVIVPGGSSVLAAGDNFTYLH